MRGRTLNNAFIVVDGAQNCTYGQIKMLLTRLGWHSTMVVTGDPDQSDLLDGLSGLADIARRLEPIAAIAVIRLGDLDSPPSSRRRCADRPVRPANGLTPGSAQQLIALSNRYSA
jgi:predicted ribonuclease YlaK